MQPNATYTFASAGIAALGCTFILVQYGYNRSLWLDESLLAINLIQKDYRALLLPLDNNQVAPILFLWIERFFVQFFGPGEMSLRAFPVLGALLSIVLFWSISRKIIPDNATRLLAQALFVLSPSLIYFATEVKQYMADVLVLLAVYHALLSSFRYRMAVLGLLGAVSVFLSHAGVLILFTAAIYLFWEPANKHNPVQSRFAAIPVTAMWFVCFSICYVFFIDGHPHKAEMLDYWQQAFPPGDLLSRDFVVWVLKKTVMVFTGIMAFPQEYLLFVPFIGVYVAGVAHLARAKRYALLYLLTFPALLHAVIAYFRVYPFDHRLILYQLPLFVLTVSIGFGAVKDALVRVKGLSRAPLLFLLPAGIYLFQVLRDFPTEREEIKRSIRFMNESIAPGDAVYVYHGAAEAFRYYRQTRRVDFGNPAVFGRRHDGHPAVFAEDLAPFQGRTWVLFSHLNPFQTQAEAAFILDYCSGRGVLLKSFQTKGSAVYLFDLQKDK